MKRRTPENRPKAPEMRPANATSAHGPGTLAGGIEETQVPIGPGASVGLIFLAMPCIREHQALIIQDRLRGIADRCQGRLAVSLAEVDDITSAGVNALVVVHTHCRKVGGHLALFGLSREIQRLFKLTHLDRTMVVTDDSQSAVQSFTAPQRKRWSLMGRSADRRAA